MKQRSLPDCGPLVGIVLVTAALWVLHHELREYPDHDGRCQVEERPPSHLLFALAAKDMREQGFALGR
jgi:hypothetical protein